MAQMIFRAYALGLLCVLVLVQKGGAYEFVVGGQKGWCVPSDPNNNPYNQWAEKSRFQIGDSLVFNYQAGQDSVLQVKDEDYGNCNTNAPIAKFSNGHTVLKLNQSGSHFFISGKKENCLKNEKIVVIVLADRSNNRNSSSSVALSPPSPAPTAGGSAPSPAPTGQVAPPSPPLGSVQPNPTPSPSAEPLHPNNAAASSVLVSFAGSVGAFLASALVFSL